MKLRSIICASAVAAAMAASATVTVTGGNTFARLPVTTSYTNSIIAIPFSGCGESGTQIFVTNLVQTTNLAQGDTLMYKEGNNWYAWEINASGNWQALATTESTTVGGVTFTPSANATALACGKACWLYRSNPSATVYLYGQTNGVLPSVEIAAGTSSAMTYTIVGYPNEAAALDLATWHPANATNGDLLIIPATGATGQKTYKYNGSAWTKKTASTSTSMTNPFAKIGGASNTVTTYTDTPITEVGTETIPAGCGFMYGRSKNAAAFTLAW